jgi:2-alkenal reductase
LFLVLIVAVPVLLLLPMQSGRLEDRPGISLASTPEPIPDTGANQQPVPTLTLAPAAAQSEQPSQEQSPPGAAEVRPSVLANLYNQLNPGVVSIQVYVEQQGLSGVGAGSGFILDDQGHIVTNNHVVAEAQQVTAIFYNGIEANAEVVGTDPESDLAIIRVDQLPEGAHAISLGDSDQVQIGEWVLAIGNPFGLGSSMTVGIVSAKGRVIPTGVTPFSIPQAIQTDAPINPGNSGGPLMNMNGEVIGVNAQIAVNNGVNANAGVGFAIPANIVRRVAPALIETGTYHWPWLGIEGDSVNLAIMEANNLNDQQGAYIHQVIPNGPADQAGLRGSTGTSQVGGLEVPVGGDVVVEANGAPIREFSDLLVQTAFSQVGDPIQLSIIRDGQRQEITVELAARPADFGNQTQ